MDKKAWNVLCTLLLIGAVFVFLAISVWNIEFISGRQATVGIVTLIFIAGFIAGLVILWRSWKNSSDESGFHR